MTKRNVVWIASYPKSGNTWLISLLRVAGRDDGFPENSLDVYEMIRQQRTVPICRAVDEDVVPMPCSVLKTHSAYAPGRELHRIPDMELVTAGFVHIYRNPLDVLLSYINFTRLAYKTNIENAAFKRSVFVDLLGFDKPVAYDDWLTKTLDTIPRKNLDHALDMFSESDMAIRTVGMAGSWLQNTASWIDAVGTLPGCSLRYEDCLEDPANFMKIARLFKFSEDRIVAAVEEVASAARAKSGKGNDYRGIFFNKMQAYYFAQYFSPAAVARFFAKHEQALRRFGYGDLLSRA